MRNALFIPERTSTSLGLRMFYAVKRQVWPGGEMMGPFNDDLCDEEILDHPSLLGLPKKLRERIYRATLVKPCSLYVNEDWKPPALVQVNRRIRNEACEMFYLKNHFTVACPRFSSKLLTRFLERSGPALYKRRMMAKDLVGQEHGFVVPRWKNLVAWLKLYHDKRVPRFVYRHEDPDVDIPRLSKLAERAFRIVEKLRGQEEWAEILATLEDSSLGAEIQALEKNHMRAALGWIDA